MLSTRLGKHIRVSSTTIPNAQYANNLLVLDRQWFAVIVSMWFIDLLAEVLAACATLLSAQIASRCTTAGNEDLMMRYIKDNNHDEMMNVEMAIR